MNKQSTDIFSFNIFNEKKELNDILFNKYFQNLLAVGSMILGLFCLYSSFKYLNTNFLVFIVGIMTFFVFSIYRPIIDFVHDRMYVNLILKVELSAENHLVICLYNKQEKHIKNYVIFEDWKPYFSSFYLFFQKVDFYKGHVLLNIRNSKCYTIKDIDTGEMFFYVINKDKYLNKLIEDNYISRFNGAENHG